MKKGSTSDKDFNWDELNLEVHDLHGLDSPIIEEEMREAINGMPSDKAPGPDGFIGRFYATCWPVIIVDFMRAMD